jgi:hypothetical protein
MLSENFSDKVQVLYSLQIKDNKVIEIFNSGYNWLGHKIEDLFEIGENCHYKFEHNVLK